ncbi:MAG TPA: high-potential iron-sulfur protein [Burkholderiaceae bacterium]|nr:high-potential iron-sulfur protein [Burkholderiaceae bacterium]
MTNRRIFIMQAVAGLATAGLGRLAAAAERSPLREDDPKAVEFAYVTDTRRVDQGKFPEHRPDQQCAACQIYEDGPDGMGGCPLFPGKLVLAGGWCSAFN